MNLTTGLSDNAESLKNWSTCARSAAVDKTKLERKKNGEAVSSSQILIILPTISINMIKRDAFKLKLGKTPRKSSCPDIFIPTTFNLCSRKQRGGREATTNTTSRTTESPSAKGEAHRGHREDTYRANANKQAEKDKQRRHTQKDPSKKPNKKLPRGRGKHSHQGVPDRRWI